MDRRQLAELVFDLRKTAAFQLLRRMGAQQCGNSLVIGRGLLMARLREAHENHHWRWESERRQSVQRRIESVEPQRRRKSLVTVNAALAKQMEELRTAGLPGTIQLTAGLLIIHCNDMEDLLRQLVLLAKKGVSNSQRRPRFSVSTMADNLDDAALRHLSEFRGRPRGTGGRGSDPQPALRTRRR